ncbi:hypothetical protein HDV01_003470 [Terramyces sp. JEL0728]|nr:hypothetical protein HDV01_003470 [Terramyces sp. JEL0728]
MALIIGGKRVSQRLLFALGALLYIAIIVICTIFNGMSYNHRQGSGVGGLTFSNVNVSNQIIAFNPTALQITDARDSLQQVSSSIPIIEAHTVTYPFDTYYTIVSVLVKDFSSQKPIPFSYDFSGAIDLWKSDIEAYGDGSSLGPTEETLFEITITRTYITIVFSIFLYAIMWVLSGAAFMVTLSIWTRGRKVEPPTIAAVGAILFALPNIRNAQPGAPAVGCNADIVAFFPCLILVTASVAMGLINYFSVYKADAKVQPAKAPLVQNDTVLNMEGVRDNKPPSIKKEERPASVKSAKKDEKQDVVDSQPRAEVQSYQYE